MAESATAWQTQQKDKATSTKVKKPDIPGDYGGHSIPPVPVTRKEGFVGSYESIAWPALVGAATLLLVFSCVNGLNKR
jgi:hypothetical protein